jgi:hypothetical protein
MRSFLRVKGFGSEVWFKVFDHTGLVNLNNMRL